MPATGNYRIGCDWELLVSGETKVQWGLMSLGPWATVSLGNSIRERERERERQVRWKFTDHLPLALSREDADSKCRMDG